MKNQPKNIPPADQPDWGAPFNWEWFKFHHLETLEKIYKNIDEHFKGLPLGKGYEQKDITLLLYQLDELAKLINWLPDSGGGQGNMEKIIESRNKFEANYLSQDVNDMSYWDAQEIVLKVFTTYNYMSGMCED